MHRFIVYISIAGVLAQACQDNAHHDTATRKDGYNTELKTKEELLGIPGFGAKRAEKYGKDIIVVVRATL